jgi:hypothetical protein
MTRRPCRVCGMPIPSDKEDFGNSLKCPMQDGHVTEAVFCHMCDHFCDPTSAICGWVCPTHDDTDVRH